MKKMKKLGLVMIAGALVATISLQPSGGGGEVAQAATLSQIQKEISAANQKIKDAERKAADVARQKQNAEQEQKTIARKKEDVLAEINSLMKEIDKVAIEQSKKKAEKEAKQVELLQTGQDLELAEKRVVDREALLEARMRLMYSNGFVSYMDVLFSATSFSDFLDRFDALQTILDSDRDMVKRLKEDKELVAQKKVEVEAQFAELEVINQELMLKHADLVKKESEKEVLIASYNEKAEELSESIEEFEVISEEQEKLLVALAAQVSKLQAEEKRIKNPYSGGKLAMPIRDSYRVSSNFGTRIHPISGKKHTHTGIDFAAPQGTAIYAAESGVVIVSQNWSGYGNCIIIDHGNGLWTLYGHIMNGGLLVDVGDEVKRGDKIAKVGSTGNSTGPHLHFEVRKNEVPVNPGGYLK
ncbi:peptidoglycan DD-metalloendopeptidase family protein [Paenibacillus sp. PL2-23]|uniref:murein hydrolase activator EnvC family protein n=1 Tax=Paenibacillus sp. PL2-23 TaxID=2100729 RepID=UPI0030F976B5